MKVILVLLVATLALAQAKRDWSKIIIKSPLHVEPVNSKVIPNKPGLKITNGNEAEPHSRPWQVGLFLEVEGGTAFCGGSLIDERTVLTAAHCVDEVIGSIEVVLGAHNIREDEPTQVSLITRDFVYHEEWDSQYVRNDVALIKLPSAVTLNENIQTIPLVSTNDDFVGDEANVSGWGKDSDSATTISSVLREVTLPVITNSECAEYYGTSIIRPGHLCADTPSGRSTCNGDSGGPLVYGGEQIGIVSFGVIFGCEVGYPAAFTRITEYLDWISSHRT